MRDAALLDGLTNAGVTLRGPSANGAPPRNPAAAKFGYDAVDQGNRRRAATGLARSEDQELPGTSRRRMVSQARDLQRNFSIAKWMVRRHLDYVTTFRFQSRTRDTDQDRRIEDLMRWWSEPENCDVAARHPLPRIIRMTEARATIDGDCGLLKVADGRLQGIEGDRIRNLPTGQTPFDWGHGVRLDEFGRAISYSVHKRVYAGGFQFEREVSAQNMYLHARYGSNRFDQVRGISELADAMNTLIDVYENFDLALAKSKVAQMFGLIIKRQGGEPIGNHTRNEQDLYDVDLGRGPFKLEIDREDDAQFLDNDTPGTAFQEFTQAMISAALKALDIPFSFYAENYTNYSGARQALLQYEQSAKIKRDDVRRLLNHLTRWRLRIWEARGRLAKSLRADRLKYEWVHAGLPWLDPMSETQANILAIDNGLECATDVLAQQGRDFEEVTRKRAYELEFRAGLGLKAAPAPDAALSAALLTHSLAARNAAP